MATQIDLLASLQEVDQQIQDKEKRARTLKQRMAALLSEAQSKESQLQEYRQQVEGWEARYQELAGQLSQEEKKLKEKRSRLYRIRSERELQAQRYEIDLAKEYHSHLEEETLVLMEQVEQGRTQLQQMEEEVASLRTLAQKEKAELEKVLATLQAEIQQQQQERQRIAAKIDTNLLQQYERIFSRRGGIAVVSVQAGTCQGCHMHIPPQMCNEIQAGRSIFLCPHCSRILYWSQTQEETQEDSRPKRQRKSNGRSSADADGRKVRTPQGGVAVNGGPS